MKDSFYEIMVIVAEAVKKARDGINFDTRSGAVCPFCEERLKVLVTKPWMDKYRFRYHRCDNPDCVLCALEVSIRSCEEYNNTNPKKKEMKGDDKDGGENIRFGQWKGKRS